MVAKSYGQLTRLIRIAGLRSIQERGFSCRVVAEADSHQRGKEDRERYRARPPGYVAHPARRDIRAETPTPSRTAIDPPAIESVIASTRNCERMSPRLRIERLPQSNFARALANRDLDLGTQAP
jgi:hypothetical protein